MRKLIAWTSLCVCIGVMGCGDDNARWEAAQQASEENGVAVVESALHGSVLNQYFPEQEGDVDIVFKQEKDGFSQASLHRAGDLVAMLSISDTRNNPGARNKYEDSTETVAGAPLVVDGNRSSILVADRFQVQVQSEGEALTAEDRAKWLEQFDLDGLAGAF